MIPSGINLSPYKDSNKPPLKYGIGKTHGTPLNIDAIIIIFVSKICMCPTIPVLLELELELEFKS